MSPSIACFDPVDNIIKVKYNLHDYDVSSIRFHVIYEECIDVAMTVNELAVTCLFYSHDSVGCYIYIFF